MSLCAPETSLSFHRFLRELQSPTSRQDPVMGASSLALGAIQLYLRPELKTGFASDFLAGASRIYQQNAEPLSVFYLVTADLRNL